MATFTFTCEHLRASDYKGKETDSPRLALQKIATFINGLAGGSYQGTSFEVSQDPASATVTLSGVAGVAASGSVALSGVGGTAATGSYALSNVGGTAATGSITFSGSTGAWTVTINGQLFSGTSAGDDDAEGDELASLIAGNPTIDALLTASNDNGVVTLTAKAKGTAGNAITLAVTGTGVARSGANMTGGVQGAVTVVINGTSVGPVNTTNLTDTAAATAVAAAITANGTLGPLLFATGDIADVELTWAAMGTVGNVSLAVGVSATGTATRSGATMTGGEQGGVSVTVDVTEVGPVDTTNMTDEDAAVAVAAALNADATLGPLMTAAGNSTDVDITWNTAGVAGNVTLDAATETGTALPSAATLENGADNDVTVTIGGVAVVSDTTALSNADAATLVAADINADAGASEFVTATAATNVVTLTAKAAGDEGNSISLTAATDGGTALASGSTLSGGSASSYNL